MTHIKPDDVPIWLWLRWVAERVWMADWPADWYCWRSIVEQPTTSHLYLPSGRRILTH